MTTDQKNPSDFECGKRYACDRIMHFIITHEKVISEVSAAAFVIALSHEIFKINREDMNKK